MPGKRSRTRTQASSVPMTAFTTVAIAAAPSVSSSAETLAGFETAVQKPSRPPVRTCAKKRRKRQQDDDAQVAASDAADAEAAQRSAAPRANGSRSRPLGRLPRC